jgi:ADP-ribosyl-[dinitrogen reductase] hydrolase
VIRASPVKRERVLGCLLGGALGDAWGGFWENRPGPVDFRIPARSWISDDTQFTLATCESIIERGNIHVERLASYFAELFKAGRFSGMGASTLKSMRDLSAGIHWALAGNRGEFAAGNGAAMRVAPLAFLLDPDSATDRCVLRDVCRITHHHDEAYIGALAVILALRSAINGSWSRENTFLRTVENDLPDSAIRDRIRQVVTLKSSPAEVASRFGASGWVVDTVPLALYCAQYIADEPLPNVVIQAIEAGGDTDTIASITGQLAGAAAGTTDDYTKHFSTIHGGAEIIGTAERFADFIGAREQ